MKRPLWMKIVGVLAIVSGLWGVIGGVIAIVSSSVNLAMEPETNIMSDVSGGDAPEAEPAPNPMGESENTGDAQQSTTSTRGEVLDEPKHFLLESPVWAIVLGVISLLVSGVYLLAGVFLLTKPFAIKFFYYAMAGSILWTVVQLVLSSQAQITMILALAPFFARTIVWDLILAGIVYAGTRLQPPGQSVTQDRKLLADAASILTHPLEVGVPVITGAFAALCALVLPFWIVGVPGVENNYARGWEMGLHVIMVYPLAWVVVFGVSRFLRKRISSNRQPSFTVGTSSCLSLFFVLALFRLVQAFRIMAM